MSQSRPYVAISLPPSATPAPATTTTTTTTTPPRSPSRTSTSPCPNKTHQPISPPSSVPSYSRSQLARRPRRVLQYIRRIYHGRLSTVQLERHRSFTLLPTEWTVLQNAVFAGRLGTWARDKLRWDYDADTHQVTLRMLSPLHEKFIRELERLIDAKTDALRNGAEEGSQTRTLLEAISGGRSPSIPLSTFEDKSVSTTRSPDVSYIFAGVPLPLFVAEVTLSQDGATEFPFIAEQYLLNTLGKVRTFLGFDIEYRDSTKRSNTALPPRWATYYLCRFELQDGISTVSTGKVVKYHDAHGVVDPDTILSLHLCDFCPAQTVIRYTPV
jgi:hypothetical protein